MGAFLRFTTMKTYTLPIEPMPCPRPRVALRGKVPVAYYPSKYNVWRDAVANLLENRSEGEAFTGPLAVTLHVYATRPKSTILDAPKADVDNYAKALLDACTKAGVWKDDSQVVHLTVRKAWAATGLVTIDITRLEPQP